MSFLTFNYTWLYLLITMIAIIMLFVQSKGVGGSASLALSPKDAISFSNDTGAVFVDIRSEEQFKTSSLPTARHILPENLVAQIAKINKKKPIILVDEFDRQAFRIARELKKSDPERAYFVLQGGISAWQKENLPLKKGKS